MNRVTTLTTNVRYIVLQSASYHYILKSFCRRTSGNAEAPMLTRFVRTNAHQNYKFKM